MPTREGRSIPPGFWGLPAVCDALSLHDLGDVFNLLHEQFGWSQYQIAGMTGLTQPQVCGYMHHKGPNGPTMNIIARAADGLGMPADVRRRFGLAPPVIAKHPQADSPKLRLPEIFNLAEHIGQTGDTSGLVTWRETARAVAPGTPWPRLIEVMSVDTPAELPGPKRVMDRTRGFFLAATKLPARLLVETLSVHVMVISLLLESVGDPGERRKLTMSSGETSYLIACCNVDLGDPGSASDGLQVTSEAAREADDAALAAITLDGHSHFQAFTGDRRKALDLVQQGLAKAAAADSPGTLAHLQLRAAEAHVDLGHTVQAARAWEQAESSFAATDPRTDRNWTRLWLTPECFASVRAFIYASTGREDQVVPVAQGVVSRLSIEGTLGKVDAVALVNAAIALALAGEFSAAARAGQQALVAIRDAEVRGTMPRAHRVAQMIRDHGKLNRVHKAFLDDVEATQRQLDALQPKRAG